VIRPLIRLLHPDCKALENFEALLALCNIASVSDATRKHILKEGGLSKIENMMFEEHTLVRRAATQVMTNLATCPEVRTAYEGDNDKMKFIFLLCAEEDEETMKAAAGATAILTYNSIKCCEKIFEAASWLETLQVLLANPNADVQYRGTVIINNIISKSQELAEKIIATDIMEILMALTLLKEEEQKKTVEAAKEALASAEKWKIIKPPEPEGQETQQN